MIRRFSADHLEVCVCEDRQALGRTAAGEFAACANRLLEQKPFIRVIFAAAPSQNEFLDAIASDPSIDFGRIDAFHMDEYIGLPPEAPQGFGNFLRRALFDRRAFHSVSYLQGGESIEALCSSYAERLSEAPVDIVCMGIGENGHIAFNDPHAAEFDDPQRVKVVRLDETCRRQQVHDGCFAALDQVPTHAVTLTVSALAQAACHFCMVPTALKAEAVRATVEGPVGEGCPATVLRTLPGSFLYLDRDSASLLGQKGA